MNGLLEYEDRVPLPPSKKEQSDAEWVRAEPFGPLCRRPFVPLAEKEPDPHEQLQPEYRLSRREPMTGGHLSLLPQWRRKPPYRTLPSGEAEMHMSDEVGEDCVRWSRSFALDARLCYVRSHIHKCQSTCWKHSGGGVPGDVVRVCRFNFNHEHTTVLYRPRNPDPKVNRCRSKKCPFWKSSKGVKKVLKSLPGKECRSRSPITLRKVIKRFPPGDPLGDAEVHPKYCPSVLAYSEVRKMPMRRGKDLVLPQMQYLRERDGYADQKGKPIFLPRVNRDVRYGRLGRVMPLRYNPSVGSSNPVAQVLMRCNLDVQCTDRVHVLLDTLDDELFPSRDPAAAREAEGDDRLHVSPGSQGCEVASLECASAERQCSSMHESSGLPGGGKHGIGLDDEDDGFSFEHQIDTIRSEYDAWDEWDEGLHDAGEACANESRLASLDEESDLLAF